MKKVALSEVKDDLSRYLHIAENEEVVITRHGKPAGVLIGFETEDDWFDYRLENDPRFLRRIEKAGNSIKSGKGVQIGRRVALSVEIDVHYRSFGPQSPHPGPLPEERGLIHVLSRRERGLLIYPFSDGYCRFFRHFHRQSGLFASSHLA